MQSSTECTSRCWYDCRFAPLTLLLVVNRSLFHIDMNGMVNTPPPPKPTSLCFTHTINAVIDRVHGRLRHDSCEHRGHRGCSFHLGGLLGCQPILALLRRLERNHLSGSIGITVSRSIIDPPPFSHIVILSSQFVLDKCVKIGNAQTICPSIHPVSRVFHVCIKSCASALEPIAAPF